MCQSKHRATALTGEGARRYGGRWNPKGRAALYAASTQSLAALEILVHVDTDLVPNDFIALALDIPGEDIAVEKLALAELPANWREEYPPLSCQEIGGRWLDRGEAAVLVVPSAIIPEESNFILNPRHPDFAKIPAKPPAPFTFDPRLWRQV